MAELEQKQAELAALAPKVAAADAKLDTLRAAADGLAAQLAEAKAALLVETAARDALRFQEMGLQNQVYALAGGIALVAGGDSGLDNG